MSVQHADSFVIVPGWLIEATAAAATCPKALAVYCALGTFADNKTGECTPSRRAIAERAGCSLDTLDRAVAWLVALGAVTKEARPDEAGDQTSNRWIVHRATPAGGRVGAATPPRGCGDGGRVGAATGGRVGAALTKPNGTRPNELDHFAVDSVAHGEHLFPVPTQQPGKATTGEPCGAGGTPVRVGTGNEPLDRMVAALVDAAELRYAELPARSRGAAAKAARELLDIGATPDQVAERAGNFRTRWTVTVTPSALASRWAECATPAKGAGSASENGRRLLAERRAAEAAQ